jgi:hypothetical protein
MASGEPVRTLKLISSRTEVRGGASGFPATILRQTIVFSTAPRNPEEVILEMGGTDSAMVSRPLPCRRCRVFPQCSNARWSGLSYWRIYPGSGGTLDIKRWIGLRPRVRTYVGLYGIRRPTSFRTMSLRLVFRQWLDPMTWVQFLIFVAAEERQQSREAFSGRFLQSLQDQNASRRFG